MHRVRQRERPITLDDQKILVVAIRGFVAEIMAAAGDDRIIGQRIDDDDLVVNDCVTILAGSSPPDPVDSMPQLGRSR